MCLFAESLILQLYRVLDPNVIAYGGYYIGAIGPTPWGLSYIGGLASIDSNRG
jgi:hypothetical protein